MYELYFLIMMKGKQKSQTKNLACKSPCLKRINILYVNKKLEKFEVYKTKQNTSCQYPCDTTNVKT